MVGPDYHRPTAPLSVAYKELPGWTPASPRDAIDKGAWWSAFHDPLLDRLIREIDVSNQTLREAEASYRQSQALVREARAGLFPTLSLDAGVTRTSRGGSSGLTTSTINSPSLTGGTPITATSATTSTGSTGTATSSSSGGSFGGANTIYSLEGSANWDLDVWGRIRREIQSNVTAAQASAADLVNARLSAQGSLATDYFELRASDALLALLQRTAADYTRSLQITQNQYLAGIAARSDVLTAQVQLESVQAQVINVGINRAQYEHAIAVLTGHPPADLTIPPGPLAADVPVVPAEVPSTLLERRPDIAAAERQMEEENALVGVAVAAYYPDVNLSALYGYSGNPIGSLISVANRVWSLGASASDALFEGGTRSAQVAAARAVYDESVAVYRQTVLTALQQVEDELAALRILQQQAVVQQAAVGDAQRSTAIALNEYRAGTVAYTTVVTAEATQLADEETLLTIQQERLVASVGLIQALGGGWDVSQLPSKDSLQRGLPFLQ